MLLLCHNVVNEKIKLKNLIINNVLYITRFTVTLMFLQVTNTYFL